MVKKLSLVSENKDFIDMLGTNFADINTHGFPGFETQPQSMHGLFDWTELRWRQKQLPSCESNTFEDSEFLNKKDIPCSSLSKRDIERCSAIQLKRCLTCRGAKFNGTEQAALYNRSIGEHKRPYSDHNYGHCYSN